MKKEDIKEGLKVKYDKEIVTIIKHFPQIQNTSPSGDILIEDNFGLTELVNHNELEKIKSINCKCGQHLADKDKENNLFLDSEIEYVFRHSTWNEVECPNCNKNNSIDGFIDLESFNKSTLEN